MATVFTFKRLSDRSALVNNIPVQLVPTASPSPAGAGSTYSTSPGSSTQVITPSSNTGQYVLVYVVLAVIVAVIYFARKG